MDSLALTFQISNVFTERFEERLTANKSERTKQTEQLDHTMAHNRGIEFYF